MTPEQRAFAVVLALLGTPCVVALILALRVLHRAKLLLLRLRAIRRRERRRVRSIFASPEPRRVAGFLGHLVTRDSEPPPSAFVHVLAPREVVVHQPAPTRWGREVMRPRCRTSREPG